MNTLLFNCFLSLQVFMDRYNMASLIVDENNDPSLGYIVDYMSFS
jgi:hypothetical protein